jgi:predicted RNA methylase
MPKFIGFVPTPDDCVDGFFELATVSSSDVVYDLGSGDGRLLFAALEKGARQVVGVELDAELVRLARETAENKGVADRATFIEADVLDVNLANATLVLCYLFPTASEALRPKFESELKQGTRIVMEAFRIPGWKPLKTTDRGSESFYLYVVPAEATD